MLITWKMAACPAGAPLGNRHNTSQREQLQIYRELKRKNSPLLILLRVRGEQADLEPRRRGGNGPGLHAAHEPGQQVQLLLGQQVGSVRLQDGERTAGFNQNQTEPEPPGLDQLRPVTWAPGVLDVWVFSGRSAWYLERKAGSGRAGCGRSMLPAQGSYRFWPSLRTLSPLSSNDPSPTEPL